MKIKEIKAELKKHGKIVNMKCEIIGRKFVLKDDDQGEKQYSTFAKLSFNNTDEGSFIISARRNQSTSNKKR